MLRMIDTWRCVTGSWDALSPSNQATFIGTLISLLLLLWRTNTLRTYVGTIQKCRQANTKAVQAAKQAAMYAKGLQPMVNRSPAVAKALDAATGAAAAAEAAAKAAERAACFANEQLTDNDTFFQRMPMGSTTVVVNRISRWRYVTHPWPLLWPYLCLRQRGEHFMRRMNWHQDAMRIHAECSACNHQRKLMLGTCRIWLLACDPTKHKEVRRVENFFNDLVDRTRRKDRRESSDHENETCANQVKPFIILVCPEGYESEPEKSKYFFERSSFSPSSDIIVKAPQVPKSRQPNATEMSVIVQDIAHTIVKKVAAKAAKTKIFTAEALQSVTITRPRLQSDPQRQDEVSDFTFQVHDIIDKGFHGKEKVTVHISYETQEAVVEDEEKEPEHRDLPAELNTAKDDTGALIEKEPGTADEAKNLEAAGQEVKSQELSTGKYKGSILCIDVNLEACHPECRWCGQSCDEWDPPAADAQCPTLDERLQHDRECTRRPRCTCRPEQVYLDANSGKIMDALRNGSGPSRSNWANARVTPDALLPFPVLVVCACVGAWLGHYTSSLFVSFIVCQIIPKNIENVIANRDFTKLGGNITMFEVVCNHAKENIAMNCGKDDDPYDIDLHYIAFCSTLCPALIMSIMSFFCTCINTQKFSNTDERRCKWSVNGCKHAGTNLKEHEKHCPHRPAYSEENHKPRSTLYQLRILYVAVLTGITVMPMDADDKCNDCALAKNEIYALRILAASGNFIILTKCNGDSLPHRLGFFLTATFLSTCPLIYSLIKCNFWIVMPLFLLIILMGTFALALHLVVRCSRQTELSVTIGPLLPLCWCNWIICYLLRFLFSQLDEIWYHLFGVYIASIVLWNVRPRLNVFNIPYRCYRRFIKLRKNRGNRKNADTYANLLEAHKLSQTTGAKIPHRVHGTVVKVKYKLSKQGHPTGHELVLPADETIEGLKQKIEHIHKACCDNNMNLFPVVKQHIWHRERGVLHNEMRVASECMQNNARHVVELTLQSATLRLSCDDCVEIFMLALNVSVIAGGFTFLMSDDRQDITSNGSQDKLWTGHDWYWRHVFAGIACLISFGFVWATLWNSDWYRKQDMDILQCEAQSDRKWFRRLLHWDYVNMRVFCAGGAKDYCVTQRTRSMWRTRLVPLLQRMDPERSSTIFVVYAAAVMSAIGNQIENLVCDDSKVEQYTLFSDYRARLTMLLEFSLFLLVSFAPENDLRIDEMYTGFSAEFRAASNVNSCDGHCQAGFAWKFAWYDAMVRFLIAIVTDAKLMLRLIPAVVDICILWKMFPSFKFHHPYVQLVLNLMRVVIVVKFMMSFDPQLEIIRGVRLGGSVSQITVGACHTRSSSRAGNEHKSAADEIDEKNADEKRDIEYKLKVWLYERLYEAEPGHLWDTEPDNLLKRVASLMKRDGSAQQHEHEVTKRVKAWWKAARSKRDDVATVLREFGISLKAEKLDELVLLHARFKRDTVVKVLWEAGIPFTEQAVSNLVLPHESPPCIRLLDKRLLKMAEATFKRHMDGETRELPLSKAWRDAHPSPSGAAKGLTALKIPTTHVAPLPGQWEGVSQYKRVSFTGWIPQQHVDEHDFHRCKAATDHRRTEVSQALYASLTFIYGGLTIVQCRYKVLCDEPMGCNFPSALMLCFAIDSAHRGFSVAKMIVSSAIKRYEKRLRTQAVRQKFRDIEKDNNENCVTHSSGWYRLQPYFLQEQPYIEKSVNIDTTKDFVAAIVVIVSLVLELLSCFHSKNMSGTMTNLLLRLAICCADAISRKVDVLPLGILRHKDEVNTAPYCQRVVGYQQGAHNNHAGTIDRCFPQIDEKKKSTKYLCVLDDTERPPSKFITSKTGRGLRYKPAFHMIYRHVDKSDNGGHRGAGSWTVRNELERYKALKEQCDEMPENENGAPQWWCLLSDIAKCMGCKLHVCKPKLVFTVAPRGCAYEELVASRAFTYDAVEQAQAQGSMADTEARVSMTGTRLRWSKLKNTVRMTSSSISQPNENAKKQWDVLRKRLTVASAFASQPAGSHDRAQSAEIFSPRDVDDQDSHDYDDRPSDYTTARATDGQQTLASTAKWTCKNKDCDVDGACNSYLQLKCVVCDKWSSDIPKLHRAALNGSKKEVQKLLNADKKLTYKKLDEHLDMYGRTALYFCTEYPYKEHKAEHEAIATLLRNRGARNTTQSTRRKSENRHWKQLRLKANVGALLGNLIAPPAIPPPPSKTIKRQELAYFANDTNDPLLECGVPVGDEQVSKAITAVRTRKCGTMWRCEVCLKHNVSLAEVCAHCDVARLEVRKISVRVYDWDSGSAGELNSYVVADDPTVTHAVGVIDYQCRGRKQRWEDFSSQFDNMTGQIRVFGHQDLHGWQVCSQECHAEGANIISPARSVPNMKGMLFKKIDEAQWKMQMKAKLTQKKTAAAISASDMWGVHYCVLDALTCSIRLYASEAPEAPCDGTYRIYCKARSLRSQLRTKNKAYQGGYRGCEDVAEKRLIDGSESYRFKILLASESGGAPLSIIVAASSRQLKREWMQRIDEAARYYEDTLHVKQWVRHRAQLNDGRSRQSEVEASGSQTLPRWDKLSELTWRYFKPIDRQRIAFQKLKDADDIRLYTERLHVLATPILRNEEAKKRYDGELLEQGDRVVVHENDVWYRDGEGKGWAKSGIITNVRGVTRDKLGNKRIIAPPTYDVKYDPVGGSNGYKDCGPPIYTHEVVTMTGIDTDDKNPGKIKFAERIPEHWFPRLAHGGDTPMPALVRLSKLGRDFPEAEPPLDNDQLYYVKRFDDWALRLFLFDVADGEQPVQFKSTDNFGLILQVPEDNATHVPRDRIQRCTWIEVATQSRAHRNELQKEIYSMHLRGQRCARKEKLIRRKNPKQWSARKAVICHVVAAGCTIVRDKDSHSGLMTFYSLYFTCMFASMISCFAEHRVWGLCPDPETFCRMRCVLLMFFTLFALAYTILFRLRRGSVWVRSLFLRCMMCLMAFAFLWSPRCTNTGLSVSSLTATPTTTIGAPIMTTTGSPFTTTAGSSITTTAGSPITATTVLSNTTLPPSCECRTKNQGNWTVVPYCESPAYPNNVCHCVRATMNHASAGAMSIFTILFLVLSVIAKMLQLLFPYITVVNKPGLRERVIKFCKRLGDRCKAQCKTSIELCRKKNLKRQKCLTHAAEESWLYFWQALLGAAIGSLIAALFCRFVDDYANVLSHLGVPGAGPDLSWWIIVGGGGAGGLVYQHGFCRFILPMVLPIKHRVAPWILWRSDRLWSTGSDPKDYVLGEKLFERKGRIKEADSEAMKRKKDGKLTAEQSLQRAYPKHYETRWPIAPPGQVSSTEAGVWEGAVADTVRAVLALAFTCYIVLLPLIGFWATQSFGRGNAIDALPGLILWVLFLFPVWSHSVQEISSQVAHREHDLTARDFSRLFWPQKVNKKPQPNTLRAQITYHEERRSIQQWCKDTATWLGKSRNAASWLSKDAHKKAKLTNIQAKVRTESLCVIDTVTAPGIPYGDVDNGGDAIVAAPGIPYTVALQAHPRSRPTRKREDDNPALKFQLDERIMWRGEGMHYRWRRSSTSAKDRWELLNPDHCRMSNAFALAPDYCGPLMSLVAPNWFAAPIDVLSLPNSPTLLPHHKDFRMTEYAQAIERQKESQFGCATGCATKCGLPVLERSAETKKQRICCARICCGRSAPFSKNKDIRLWGDKYLWGENILARAARVRKANIYKVEDDIDYSHVSEFNSQHLFGLFDYVALVIRWLWYSNQLVVDLDTNDGVENYVGKCLIENKPASIPHDATQDGHQALGMLLTTCKVFIGDGSERGQIQFKHKHWLCGTIHGGDGSFDRVRLKKHANATNLPFVDGKELDANQVYFVKKVDDYTLRLFLPTDTGHAVKFDSDENFCLTLQVVEDAFGNPFAVHDMSFRLFDRVERYFCDAITARQTYEPVGKWDETGKKYDFISERYKHRCDDCVERDREHCCACVHTWPNLLTFVILHVIFVLGYQMSHTNVKFGYFSLVCFLDYLAWATYYLKSKVRRSEFIGGIFWEDDIRLPDFHRAALAGNLDDLKLIFNYYQQGLHLRCTDKKCENVQPTQQLPIYMIRDAPDRFGRTALYFCTKSEFKQGNSAGCEAYLRAQLGAETLYACECVRCGQSGHRSTFERLSEHKCTSITHKRTETSSEAESMQSSEGGAMHVQNPLTSRNHGRQSMML